MTDWNATKPRALAGVGTRTMLTAVFVSLLLWGLAGLLTAKAW